MGKKRKTKAFVLKPWCWYCEREFEDEKVLLQHQKSKHFKCQLCPRKLNTAGGLMVHSQQVHKCEPEPLTNTLPGRDGYDIEIFGMEGVPTNALAEWKARKEAEAGTAELAAAAAAKRPRQAYTVVPEADLMAALSQHKALMATRDKPGAKPPAFQPPPFPPMGFPSFPPPGFPPGMPPPNFMPGAPPPMPPQPPQFVAEGAKIPIAPRQDVEPGPEADVMPPKDGVMWPDSTASPAEKRALQSRYRYTSPTPGETLENGDESRKRKAAADFL